VHRQTQPLLTKANCVDLLDIIPVNGPMLLYISTILNFYIL